MTTTTATPSPALPLAAAHPAHPGDLAPPAAPRALAEHLPLWLLATLGALATLLTGPRWGVAALAWLAPVPYLLYARRARGWRPWLALLGVMAVVFPLQLLPIVTAPLPFVLIFPFGLPAALGAFLIVLASEQLRRRTGDVVGLLSFAALVALLDWVGLRWTELGAWSTTANSQVGSPTVIQLAALTGLAGIGLLMAWFAGVVTMLLASPQPRRRWPHLLAVSAALLAALAFGSARLDRQHGSRTVTVAAVVTDLGLGPHGIPAPAALAANTDTLFARTRLAAARGARLVVWNEAATLVEPADEPALLARGQREARALGVDLVLAYGTIASRAPLLLDNQYRFITSEGAIADTYRKHHPVPGEPSMRGTAPLHLITRPYARLAGAICYDYDFPALAREHSRLGADLVFVPSSDWRGIDPVHTLMARVRAVENGFSVLRSTRWAPSAAFDGYGRIRGWMPVTEHNDRVMVASVPVGRVRTLYSAVGDTPVVAASAAWLALALTHALRKRRGRG